MKCFLLLVAASVLWAVPAQCQIYPSAETEAIQKQIDATQQEINRAIRERNFSILEKFWSAQMVVNAPENTIRTREDVFADMRKGGLSYSSLKGTAESFHVFGDIAIQMGHEDFVMAAGPAAGKPLQRRYTNVWQRVGDHWVQIARQATILNADAGQVYGSTAASTQRQAR